MRRTTSAVPSRTVWRDLRVLEQTGFPIYDEPAEDGRRGLWKIDPEFKARLPLKLSLSELAAILMSRELLAPVGGSVLGSAVATAFDKIAGVLSRDALKLIDAMRETIGVRAVGAKLQMPAAELIPVIQAALGDRRTLRMRYYSFQREEETERDVDPYHLTYYDGGLYLVGYCHLRRAMRVFAVERVGQLKTLRHRFEVPRAFNIQQYLDGAWGIIQGDLVTAKVLFVAELARYVRERLWHPSQKLRDLPDGRLKLTLRVADTLEVRRWILGFGVQAEVVEPLAMREALQREAMQLAQRLAAGRKPLARIGRIAGRPATTASGSPT
jgi:predicted DNA-binding transcriptional regulator YafY